MFEKIIKISGIFLETRMESPYGYCRDYPAEDLEYVNAFEGTEYTMDAAQYTCVQKKTIEECGCGDPAYPLQSLAFWEVGASDQAAPECSTDEEWECLAQVPY